MQSRADLVIADELAISTERFHSEQALTIAKIAKRVRYRWRRGGFKEMLRTALQRDIRFVQFSQIEKRPAHSRARLNRTVIDTGLFFRKTAPRLSRQHSPGDLPLLVFQPRIARDRQSGGHHDNGPRNMRALPASAPKKVKRESVWCLSLV